MKRIFTFSLIVLCSLLAKTSSAAIDIYMKVTDENGVQINGESVAVNFQNWIELPSSFAEGSSIPITIGNTGTGASSGKATLKPIKFDMKLNSASLPILSQLFKGRLFKTVDIWFVKAGGTQNCNCAFYKIHMENVFISALDGASDDENVTQQLSFQPVKIAWAYYKQASSGAYPTTPTNKFGWDMSTNQEYVYSF